VRPRCFRRGQRGPEIKFGSAVTGFCVSFGGVVRLGAFRRRHERGSRHRVSMHAQGLRPRRAVRNLAMAVPSVLPSAYPDSVGAPERCFRGSILSLHVPLSTLHGVPYDTPRMTRGQVGSLLLSCMTLSFTTRRQFHQRTRMPSCPTSGQRLPLLCRHPFPGQFRRRYPSACSRSAMTSSGASIPTDRRTRLSRMPMRSRCLGEMSRCELITG
jgi:hypothetical protein